MKPNRKAVRTPFPKLAQPALRALATAGYNHLEQLAGVQESALKKLHGIGPNALVALRAALSQIGLSFAASSSPNSAPNEIDDYIAGFPADVQAILEKVRATIKAAAPEAKEVISYQMPAFRQRGILVYFAGWKKHIGLYPPITGDKTIEKSVARYAGPKGNLQFPLDEPIPYALIKRIVKLRVGQDMEKAAARRKKRK
jgi:uncharacterized protein YdhG (YjbR/CyaY superfamily)